MSLRPLVLLLLAVLAAFPVQAQEQKPRIAFVSIHLAEMPTAARAVAQRVRDDVTIDFFGLGGGLLPSIEGVDLGRYDLILLDAAGPRLLNFTAQIEAAKRRTKVLVVGPGTPIEGNIDPARHPDVARYWSNATDDNYRGLFLYAAARLLGRPVSVPPPVEYPPLALWHPDAPAPFATPQAYLDWHSTHLPGRAGAPRIGIIFYRSLVLADNAELVAALIREIERQGGVPVPIWREGGRNLASSLLGDTQLDALILCANRIDYASAEAGVAEAERLGVPPLMCATDYRRTSEAWAESLGGFAPASTGELAMSELDGIVEPMVVAARDRNADGSVGYKPIAAQVRWRVARAMAWARLHRLPNPEKRIVISYHNEEPGKADVGSDPDSYMDAQASTVALLRRLRAEGYDTGNEPISDRAELARRLADQATNVPLGDDAGLRERVAQGAITIPLDRYSQWYAALPQSLRSDVERIWGPPPGDIMTVDGSLVIPALHFGKVTLVAHPLWGPQTGGKALEETGALPPHHQYLAFYLWMQHEGRTDAFLPLFTQLSLMPGKQEGPAADDAVALLIGALPHIQPLPLQANGGVGNKRRTHAVTIGFMPEFARAGLPPHLETIHALLAGQPTDFEAVRAAAVEAGIEGALGLSPATAPFQDLKAALDRYIAETRAAPIPLGGHVLGQAPPAEVQAKMVQAMLAVEGTPPELDEIRLAIAGQETGLDTATAARARDFAERIAGAPREMDAVMAALSGRYVPPGPMRDAIRNPDALPAGRNPYTLDVRSVPTQEAWRTGGRLVDDLLADYRAKHRRIPRKIAFVLWSNETAQNGGTNEAQILHLLGVRPVRDARGRVVDVELIDRAELGRPRVDVLVTTSGTYRDHFGEKLSLIAKAVRLASDAEEPDNPVHSETRARIAALEAQGIDPQQARKRALRRIFSTAPGAYSPSTQFASREGWSKEELNRLYRARLSHTYGDGDEGEPDGSAFMANLDAVDAAVFSRTSSAYGLLDTPMPAAYLGGLSMAVREATGRTIDAYIANEQRRGDPRLESLDRFYGRERDSRYLNPEWIKAMQASGYNGARYMADMADSLLLWEQVRPELVTDRDWQSVRDVYLRDRYDLGMSRFFDEHNPAARDKLVHTMLDAIERGDWKADAATRAELTRMVRSAGRNAAVAQRSEGGDQEASPRPATAGPAQGPMSAPAPAGTSPAPQPPAQISGYELVPSANASRGVPPSTSRAILMPWLALLILVLVTGGAALRPRW